MKMQVKKANLLKLKAGIPHGTNKKIAEKLNLSPNYVSGVLRGKEYNPEVLELLMEAYQEARKPIEKLNEIFS